MMVHAWFDTVLASAASQAEPSFWMPPQASTAAETVDSLFYFILTLATIFFVAIMTTMFVFVVRYRRRRADQPTSAVEGSRRLEIAWSVVPFILLTIIFAWGFWGYLERSVPPGNALEVRVLAQRWNWSFDYPRQGIQGSDVLVAPIDQPVKLIMSSQDVIHSFYVPAFRVKQDVLPNRYTVTWFQATKLGTYDLLCAEYCGTDHSHMKASVRVVTRPEFDAWVASGGPLGQIRDPVELGKKLFHMRGCYQCHSVDGSATGKAPSLFGKYGAVETLNDGSQIAIDDNYIRESVMSPQAKIVQGWQNAFMPTFRGRLDEKQINALIDYLKSIGK